MAREGDSVKQLVEHEPDLSVDDFLVAMGQWGRFQTLLIAVFCLVMIPGTYQTLIMAFAGSSPAWQCTFLVPAQCNRSGAFNVEDPFYSKRCSMDRWAWKFVEPAAFSIVTEFDLVCDKKEFVILANSAVFFGWTFGAIVLGVISDKFGRKIVLWPSLLVILVSGFASGFVSNFWLFFVLRLVIGFFQGGVGLTIFVMATELVGPKHRAFAGTTIWFFFTAALCIMALKAWLVPRWRMLEIICSAPYVVCVLFWRCCPESVRWLRVSGKIAPAEDVLRRVARFNKQAFPNARLSPVEESAGNKASFVDLLRPRHRLISTLIQCYAWFVNGLVYYGVSLASDSLGGSLYRNFVLTSLVEIPANVLLIYTCNRFGRRKTVVVSMVIGGLACLGVSLIPESQIPSYMWSRVSLGMLGKLCITMSFNSLYVWSVELHPTVIRSQGMGLLSVVSRLGAAAAPWVAQWLRHVHVVVPFALMGANSIAAAVVCCWLKETNNCATAEVLGDAAPPEPSSTEKEGDSDALVLSSNGNESPIELTKL